MFPNDSPAQGFGQQYSFNGNNGYYINVAKRPCFPNYPGHLQYPYLPMTTQQHPAPVYPQSYGYPPMLEEECRRRKVVQAVSNDYERPIWTFTGLSIISLLNTKDNTATTDEIYNFVLNNFPFYVDQNHASWTGAIRHNLTKKKNLFQRNSESKRNGKWSLISVEEAKKEIQREFQKSKKNANCGMEHADQFEALVGRFLPIQTAPADPSVSLILSALLSSAPVFEEFTTIQSEQSVQSSITLDGTNFQSTPVNESEDYPCPIASLMSPVSSDYVFNVPVYSEYYPVIHSEMSVSPIPFYRTSCESEPVNDSEDSPALSVEHLKFEIIEEEF